jgi:hypothetical protein
MNGRYRIVMAPESLTDEVPVGLCGAWIDKQTFELAYAACSGSFPQTKA